MTTRIDVAETIERQKLGRYQFWTFGLCTAFLFFDGFDGQIMGYAAPALIRDWNISKVALGPIFTATTLGFALGAMAFGILADRYGRRLSTLICVFVFGAFNVLTATAHSLEAMVLYRFLAGLGMGGGMPNGYALLSEYFPRRMRARVIMLAATGYALGANIGGWSAALLIPPFGWPSVFYLGGAMPLAMFFLLWPALPESIRFLVLHGRPRAEIAALLKRVNPALPVPGDATFVVAEDTGTGVSVRHLFTEGRGLVTILLWIATFMNLMVLSFVVSWMPTLLSGAGMEMQRALVLTAMFGIGGTLGVATLGFVIDRWGAHRVLGTGFLLVGIALSLMGLASDSFVAVSALMIVIGYFVPGGNAGTSAFAGRLYPTHVRSTGIGWALGVGRMGQLVSPIVGTMMMAAKWNLAPFFLAVAGPAFIAAAAMSLTNWAQSQRLRDSLAPVQADVSR